MKDVNEVEMELIHVFKNVNSLYLNISWEYRNLLYERCQSLLLLYNAAIKESESNDQEEFIKTLNLKQDNNSKNND